MTGMLSIPKHRVKSAALLFQAASHNRATGNRHGNDKEMPHNSIGGEHWAKLRSYNKFVDVFTPRYENTIQFRTPKRANGGYVASLCHSRSCRAHVYQR